MLSITGWVLDNSYSYCISISFVMYHKLVLFADYINICCSGNDIMELNNYV